MPTIRTRDLAAKTIRTLNRADLISGKFKEAFIKNKKDNNTSQEYSSSMYENGVAEMLPHISRLGIKRRNKIDFDSISFDEKVSSNAKDILNKTSSVSITPAEKESLRSGQKSSSTLNNTISSDKSQSFVKSINGQKNSSLKRANAAKQNAIQKLSGKIGSVKTKTLRSNRNILRRIRESISNLSTVLTSGGAVTIAVITLICFVGMIVASPYGIFLSKDNGGETITSVVAELSKGYYDKIEEIKSSVDYDDLEMVSNDGAYSIRWDEILSVFSVMFTTDRDNPVEVVTMDQSKKDLLKRLLEEMNSVDYYVKEELYEEVETVVDENGNETEELVEKTKRTLVLNLTHRSASEEANIYGFDSQQMTLLNDMLSGQYATLWVNLIGGYSHGLGIIPSEATWVGIGQFGWPLTINGTISSGFGYRSDPFTGEQKFHGGIDISAAAGTPIIAADNGIVTVANGVDSWGGGYGFYVMIDHGNGYETLYGHCSSICVIYGQAVQKGEVIAYVGSTGNSTGNHLHFEIRINGNKIDPLGWFY